MSWYKKQGAKAAEHQPTPAAELLKPTTLVVRLPYLSLVLGKDAFARVGVVDQALIAKVSDSPFMSMTEEEIEAHMALLSADERRATDENSQRDIATLLRAGLYEPRVSPVEGPPPPGTIPIDLLHLDRFILVKWIFVINGSWRKFLLNAMAAASSPATPGEGAPGAGEARR